MSYSTSGLVETVLNNDSATTDPTANDDSTQGYSIQSRWTNTVADTEFVCLDATATSAVWTETTQTGGGGSTQFGVGNWFDSATTTSAGEMNPNNAAPASTTSITLFHDNIDGHRMRVLLDDVSPGDSLMFRNLATTGSSHTFTVGTATQTATTVTFGSLVYTNGAGADAWADPASWGLAIVPGTLPSLQLAERADHAQTPTAGFGEFWVNNAAPNDPIFTDDAGADRQLDSAHADLGTWFHAVGTPNADGEFETNSTTVASTNLIKFFHDNEQGARFRIALSELVEGDHIILRAHDNYSANATLRISNAPRIEDTDTTVEFDVTPTNFVVTDWTDHAEFTVSVMPGAKKGGVLFAERADHVYTPAAGFGEVWLRNDATQKIIFTDDAGTDQVLNRPTPTTLASNELIDTDATEVVIGGAYLDGSSGGVYSWEILGTYNDNGGGGNQDVIVTLYDRGPDGTPVAGVLRSTITITSLDTLDRVSQALTVASSPGTDTDEIDSDEPRLYEVRAKLDASGGLDTAKILNVKFVES